MNNFLEATRTKLRVSTSNGNLSVEQLWDLSLPKLSTIIKNVKKNLQGHENDDDLAFLDETKVVDKETQLTFDILKEIYITKRNEAKAAKERADNKAHNEKIMALIHQKQEAKLGEMSIEELQAMLKN